MVAKGKCLYIFLKHGGLTLDFNVDRIRLTIDNRSSFKPVLRISGKNSYTNQTNVFNTSLTTKYNKNTLKLSPKVLPLISNICPMVEPSPDTKNESTNWTKAMRTSGLPWEKPKHLLKTHSLHNSQFNGRKSTHLLVLPLCQARKSFIYVNATQDFSGSFSTLRDRRRQEAETLADKPVHRRPS